MKTEKSVRKVLQIGECTGITLPSEYLKQAGIDRGDFVQVTFGENSAEVEPIKGRENAE